MLRERSLDYLSDERLASPEALAVFAEYMVGLPSRRRHTYPHEAKDPVGGFDCSGLVTYLLDMIGVGKPPHIRGANQYFEEFGVHVHFGLQQRGDLVFFSGDGTYPSHVGIMVSNTEYVHAPGRDNTFVTKERLPEMPEMICSDITRRHPQVFAHNPIGFKRLAVQKGRWRNLHGVSYEI